MNLDDRLTLLERRFAQYVKRLNQMEPHPSAPVESVGSTIMEDWRCHDFNFMETRKAVADVIDVAISNAVHDEREACAKAAESVMPSDPLHWRSTLVDAIRARKD